MKQSRLSEQKILEVLWILEVNSGIFFFFSSYLKPFCKQIWNFLVFTKISWVIVLIQKLRQVTPIWIYKGHMCDPFVDIRR